uniref:Uncharacterized protein n=1 Tax=viral metagenome TaxID=1070528 RepID=A0A6M3JK32_9ZZZZ
MEGKEIVVRGEQTLAIPPQMVVEAATEQARLLMDIVEKTKCYQEISGKKYLQVEAWETIGAFNRTHAETESIEPMMRDTTTIGYQARVQLWKDGVVVGGAVMPCYFTENCCKGKDGDAKHKACMSAAQTFATSKAYRMNFSYVAILAGYQPLPAEEVTDDMRTAVVVNKAEHYCKLHDTPFFMKGKMKAYAHPIKDEKGEPTGEWCHEHKAKPKDEIGAQAQTTSQPVTPKSEGVDEQPSPIDLTWLKEALDKIEATGVDKWGKKDVLARLNITVNGEHKKISDAVRQLSAEQAADFASEVADMLKML